MPTVSYQATRLELAFDLSHADLTRAIEQLLGRIDPEALTDLAAGSPEAARAKLASFSGPLDFTLFQRIDHGAVLAALTERRVPATTYVFGNALIAVEMTRHDVRAGLYVPLRLMVLEVAPQRVLVTYDLPSSILAQLASPAIDAVARTLDAKIERLLEESVRRAGAASSDVHP